MGDASVPALASRAHGIPPAETTPVRRRIPLRAAADPSRARAQDPAEQRRRHERRDERHQDHGGEERRRQDPEVEADVEDDQLDEAARVHEEPMAADSRQESPVQRAAANAPPHLPAIATTMMSTV